MRYIVFGLCNAVEAWRKERDLPPRAVIAVSPVRYTGVLRGLSADCEVITLASWAQASPMVREMVEQDIQIISCTRRQPPQMTRSAASSH